MRSGRRSRTARTSWHGPAPRAAARAIPAKAAAGPVRRSGERRLQILDVPLGVDVAAADHRNDGPLEPGETGLAGAEAGGRRRDGARWLGDEPRLLGQEPDRGCDLVFGDGDHIVEELREVRERPRPDLLGSHAVRDGSPRALRIPPDAAALTERLLRVG